MAAEPSLRAKCVAEFVGSGLNSTDCIVNYAGSGFCKISREVYAWRSFGRVQGDSRLGLNLWLAEVLI